jgi:steroid delta-isomerase-like uncharacterized protein
MPTEQNKEIVRRIAEEVWNQRNADKVDEFFAPNFVHHNPNMPDVKTREDYKNYAKVCFAGVSGEKTTIVRLIAEGDFVSKQWVWTATQTGEFFGLPPTGKSVTMTAMTIYRLENGKVVEDWWNQDVLGLWQQLGLALAPAQA